MKIISNNYFPYIYLYMEDLFDNSVIKLTDRDFNINGSVVTVKNPEFKYKDGYIMAYAPWCPNCQNKVDFWTHMGRKLNHDPAYANEQFRIGVINTTDPSTHNILRKLQVDAIPRFLHVTSNSVGDGILSEYNGQSHGPSDLLSEACKNNGKLCKFTPPAM